MTAVKWSMPYIPRLLIVNVPPVNSSGVSLPVRARSDQRMCLDGNLGEALTVHVADNGHQEPVVGSDGVTDFSG